MNTYQIAHYASMTIGYAKARILLKQVLDDNHEIYDERGIDPQLRKEIEEFLEL